MVVLVITGNESCVNVLMALIGGFRKEIIVNIIEQFGVLVL